MKFMRGGMPRYFFHIQENENSLDDEGIELGTRRQPVRRRCAPAAEFCGTATVRGYGPGGPGVCGLPISLPGGLGNTLFTIEILATEENVADLPVQRP
jgi:hypothetical protein